MSTIVDIETAGDQIAVAEPVPFVEYVSPVADDGDEVTVRKALVGLGDYQAVGGMLLVAEDAEPKLTNVGHIKLAGAFDTASLIADDTNRELVPVQKISDAEWLIIGHGRVIVVATLATREPFGIEQRRFDFTIGKPAPVDPVEPEPVDPPSPMVPEDRFDNIGQRIAAVASGLKFKKEVAANYRLHADKLVESVEASEISQRMVAARAEIIKDVAGEWRPVLDLIKDDFAPRVPDMLRNDVVDYWRAAANGLDPQ